MITINLKPGARRAKTGASWTSGLSSLKALPQKVRDPWPVAAIVAWVLTAAFLGWVGIGSATRLSRLESRLTAARSENQRFQVLIADRRRAEAAKDAVVSQIATIRSVDGDRFVWPHILDEVTRALPPYTWLTDVSAMAQPDVTPTDSTVVALPPVGVQIIGRTMDIQGFTRFMRELEGSAWLRDVTLISTSTLVDHGRAVTVFTVKASYVRNGGA